MPAAMPSGLPSSDAGLHTPSAQELLDLSPALDSGWRVERKLRDDGASVLEVFDSTGDTVGLVASRPRALVAIDAAWRGVTWDQDRRPRWWAVAIGHALRDTDLWVSFAKRRRNGGVRRTPAAIAAADGLWVAVAAGHQTTVSLRQGRHDHVQRVSATFRTQVGE
ncbi:MAG: hypothetical protein QOJ11_2163 [Frankiales bacterium]|jgi:hypothetical protein|nr:hypothetical protein [Frankiales bacterium]